MYGKWTCDIETLSKNYKTAKPYEHVIINEFFKPEEAQKIYEALPQHPDEKWWRYDNPFEGKFLMNNFEQDDPVRSVIDCLYDTSMIKYIETITGVKGLESDPYLNAGGLHYYSRNDLSGIHLDYTVHPITGKERQVSVMVYLSKDWDDSWGGNLSIWDDALSERIYINHKLWNTAVIFRTNGLAYHGFPEPIKCPEGTYRKVIGVYYLTDPSPETLENPRLNATYFPTPGKPVHEKLTKLYEIRKYRRLDSSDLEDWPEWRKDCGRTD